MEQAQKNEQEKNLFFSAKQQLDMRRISGVVTKETAPLTLRLLKEIRNLQQQLQRKNSDSTFEHSRNVSTQALTVQLRLLTLENNNLRMQILTMTDQLQSYKQKLQEMCESDLTSRIKKDSNQARLLQICRQREEQLRQELTETTYKYNQLMDLIHQDPSKAREYIKRLLKHKHIATQGTAIVRDHYGTWEAGQTRVAMMVRRDLEGRVSLLEGQLLSRNKEIQRLQSLVVQQCQIIAGRKWQNSQQQKMIVMLEDEITSLRAQNQKLKTKTSIRFGSLTQKEGFARSRSKSQRDRRQIKQVKSKDSKIKIMMKENQRDNVSASKQKQSSIKNEKNRRSQYYLSPKNQPKEKIIPKPIKKQQQAKVHDQNNKKPQISHEYFPANKNKTPSSKTVTTKQVMSPQKQEKQKKRTDQQIQPILYNQKIRESLKQSAFRELQEREEKPKLKKKDEKPETNKHQRKKSQSHRHQQYVSPTHKVQIIQVQKNPQKNIVQKNIEKPSPQKTKQIHQIQKIEQNKIAKKGEQRHSYHNNTDKMKVKQNNDKQSKQKTPKIHQQKREKQRNKETAVITQNEKSNLKDQNKRQDNHNHLKQEMEILKQEIIQIKAQRDHLRQKVKDQEKKIEDKQVIYQKQKNKSPNKSDKSLPQNIISGGNTEANATKQKMKKIQHQLATVNSQNIYLQQELNDSMARIRQLQISLKQARKAEQIQIEQQSHDADSIDNQQLIKLRRQVRRLRSQLEIVTKERTSLIVRLEQMKKALSLQSREMRRFEGSLDKKYRDVSVSP